MRALALATLLLCLAAQLPAAEVQNVRMWAGPDKTRVVLDLDRPIDYSLFTLDGPNRLVLDIDRSRFTGSLVFNDEHSGVVSGVRTGVRDGHHLRVVLDLDDEVRPQSFLLAPAGQYGHRLVVDLYPRGAQSAEERVRAVARSLPADNRDMIVAIDAGHGGEDPGAIGPSGTFEKAVTLQIARELERQINEAPGMQAVMIRTGDYYIPLRDRYERARKARADLFVSVHADAFRDFRVRGSSVYVLSRGGASSEAARLLAQSENAADLIGGVNHDNGDDMLKSVLLDLSQTASLEYSNVAAEEILGQLGGLGRVHKRKVERANFVVLRSHDVPSVLIEVGFISNPQDEQNLNNAGHRRQVAQAVLRGIDRHFRQTAPQGTWFASNRTPDQHIVRRGESLGLIAQRYSVSLTDLRRANQINGDVIHPGTVLTIPSG